MKEPKNGRICIIVLGDLGRSPRMSYHALSFAKSQFQVELVGYKGSELLEAIKQDNLIQPHFLKEIPEWFQYFPKLFIFILKTLWQAVILLYLLLRLTKCNFYLMQNPPSIPTLPVVWMISLVKRGKFVIDWHNYGYSVFSLTQNKTHPFVKIIYCVEKFFGQRADINLGVSEAMKKDLNERWNIRLTVLYDRPADIFHPITIEEQHDFFLKIGKKYPLFRSSDNLEDKSQFTMKSGSDVIKLIKRPALIVSSTSWTEDEDFSILLGALEEYDKAVHINEKLPKVICAITGKGSMKDYYLSQIASKTFRFVTFCMPWLEPEDYPKLLACADLGICLHTSSSGVDLPMKVVDMFGVQLPVCAIKYNCISELVKHGENGLVFEDKAQLVSHLKELLLGFPNDQFKLNQLRNGFKKFEEDTWLSNWNSNALHLFIKSEKTKQK